MPISAFLSHPSVCSVFLCAEQVQVRRWSSDVTSLEHCRLVLRPVLQRAMLGPRKRQPLTGKVFRHAVSRLVFSMFSEDQIETTPCGVFSRRIFTRNLSLEESFPRDSGGNASPPGSPPDAGAVLLSEATEVPRYQAGWGLPSWGWLCPRAKWWRRP